MNRTDLRVAFFPDAYYEVDGVANTSRQFEAFARRRGLPFLVVHAGPRNEVASDGSVKRIQIRRGPIGFRLDRAHSFDLAMLTRLGKVEEQVDRFKPDVVHITGPSDIGILGALIAHRLHIPLVAAWQTNLHQYARSRAMAATSFLPRAWRDGLGGIAEHWSFRATSRFYRIPRLLFAPNPEMVNLLRRVTGKPCFLMAHSVDTASFHPGLRSRSDSVFRIGYVGRMTPEKNVRALAQIESELISRGQRNFGFTIVGDGAEREWLERHMTNAEFTGQLTGSELARAFANLDVLVSPSETETFGLVVLEALASGVPAIVTSRGGPKFTVQPGKTGFIAENIGDFARHIAALMEQRELLAAMRISAREYALSTSWDRIFDGMYDAYDRYLHAANMVRTGVLDIAVG